MASTLSVNKCISGGLSSPKYYNTDDLLGCKHLSYIIDIWIQILTLKGAYQGKNTTMFCPDFTDLAVFTDASTFGTSVGVTEQTGPYNLAQASSKTGILPGCSGKKGTTTFSVTQIADATFDKISKLILAGQMVVSYNQITYNTLYSAEKIASIQLRDDDQKAFGYHAIMVTFLYFSSSKN